MVLKKSLRFMLTSGIIPALKKRHRLSMETSSSCAPEARRIPAREARNNADMRGHDRPENGGSGGKTTPAPHPRPPQKPPPGAAAGLLRPAPRLTAPPP